MVETAGRLGATRRDAAAAAVLGAGLFLACCAVTRGGLFDSAPYGDVHLYGHYARLMSEGRWPYGDFFDEYPPLAQPLFFVVRLLPGTFAPALKWTMAVFGAAALVLLVATLASVGASRTRLALAACTAGVAPVVLGPIFLNSYDLWPAMLTAGAILAFVRGHERTGYALLALGVAAKVYPLVLLPLALVETRARGGGASVRRSLLWFVGVLVAVHLPFVITGAGGLRYSYQVQATRGLELYSLGGSVFLALNRLGVHHVTLVASLSTDVAGRAANVVAAVSSVVVVAAVALVTWLYARRRRRPLVAAAAAVVAFIAFGKVISPQYVDWLVPLVPACGATPAALLLAVLGLTRGAFDRFSAPGGPNGEHYKAALTWWVLSRDLLLVALYGLLVARLARRPSRRNA